MHILIFNVFTLQFQGCTLLSNSTVKGSISFIYYIKKYNLQNKELINITKIFIQFLKGHFDNYELPKFPMQSLPQSLREYIKTVSDNLATPIDKYEIIN